MPKEKWDSPEITGKGGAVSGATDASLRSEADLAWFALYTRAHRERVVKRCLQSRSLVALLPEYEAVSGQRRLLFPGYVFVQISWLRRKMAVQIPSVTHMVHFSGEPAVIPEEQLRPYLLAETLGVPLMPWPFLKSGVRVKVKAGPLQGVEAVFDRRKKNRLILNIDFFAQAAALEVAADQVEVLDRQRNDG